MSCEDPRDPAKAAPHALRRVRASLPLLLGVAAALSVGGAVAVAADSGSGGTITGCVLTNASSSDQPAGSLRVVGPSLPNVPGCNTTFETQTTWNQQGPTGPQGPQGPAGASGAQGQQGATGAAGPQGAAGSVSVQSGSGLDIFLLLSPSNGLGTLGSAPSGEALSGSSNSSNQAIELDSFSFDTSNTTTIGSASAGAGAGKVHFEKFNFVKHLDKYSVSLFKDLASGTPLKEVEIIVRKPSGNGKEIPVVQYMLKTVALTDLHVAGQSGSPTETIQGLYGAVQFVVYEQNPTGTVKPGPTGGWNQITNQPVTSLKRIG